MIHKAGVFLLLEFFYAITPCTMALSELSGSLIITDTPSAAASTITQAPSSVIDSSNTTSVYSSSCDYCFNVFPISIVGIVAQWTVDGIFSPISTGEATSTGTLTEEIGTLTVYNDRLEGQFSTKVILYHPGITTAFPGLDNNRRYEYSYITTLSTIVPDYTSWHGFLLSNMCVQTPNTFIDIVPVMTFLPGELDFVIETRPNLPFPNSILPSEIRASLPVPTCTSFEVPTAVRTVPKLIAVAETSLIDPDSFTFDAQIPSSTKVALGVISGFGVGLALGFLAFFFWKRHGNREQTRYVSSAQRSPQSCGNYFKVQEISTANSSRSKRKSWRSYWRAPLLMLGGLLMGLAFALGHHFFYARIDSQPIDNIHLSQAWVIRFGTLLALLTRLSLAITVGTSFVQLQWLKLRIKPRSVQEIDVLTNIPVNLFSCFDRVFLHYQSLALIAVILWLLLLLPVITPGTLNIRSLPHQQNTSLVVPQYSIRDNGDIGPWGTLSFDGSGNPFSFTPSASLTQIYVPAAFKAEISSIIPQYPNQSFHLDFHGPAVNCSEAQESLILSMTSAYGISTNGEDLNGVNGEEYYPIWYSWAGGDEDWGTNRSPPRTTDFTSRDAARLFMLYPVKSGPAPKVTIEGGEYWLPKVIECSLYNASYSVDFSFLNSRQSLVTNISFLNTVPILAPPSGSVIMPGTQFIPSYVALMTGLGNLLIGSILNATNLGQVDGSNDLSQGAMINYTQAQSLSQIFVDGVYFADQMSRNIEEMFQNMTLSVITSAKPLFTTNQTVTGVVTNYLSTYIYDPLGLILTYGIAFLLSLLSAVIGFYAFSANDGSYQNLFSTFLRATKDARSLVEEDDEGADPCPETLSRVKVKVTPGISESDGWIKSPAQQYLLVREPGISHVPESWQQDKLRQRHPSGSNGKDEGIVLEEVEIDREQEIRQTTTRRGRLSD